MDSCIIRLGLLAREHLAVDRLEHEQKLRIRYGRRVWKASMHKPHVSEHLLDSFPLMGLLAGTVDEPLAGPASEILAVAIELGDAATAGATVDHEGTEEPPA
jgi:hypothetical protein